MPDTLVPTWWAGPPEPQKVQETNRASEPQPRTIEEESGPASLLHGEKGPHRGSHTGIAPMEVHDERLCLPQGQMRRGLGGRLSQGITEAGFLR